GVVRAHAPAETAPVALHAALPVSGVGFTLTSAGRRLLSCAPAADQAERFYQIYGDRRDLIPVSREGGGLRVEGYIAPLAENGPLDRKSTRLNSSHVKISYAVFCLK